MVNEEWLQGDVWQFLDDTAVGLVERYFDGVDSRGAPLFTGSRFNTLGGGGDRPGAAHQFDESDVVAVSMLSVEIPGRAALELLDTRSAELSELLAQIPVDAALESCEIELISEGSPAWELWARVESIDGIGWVTANKLLARKRPKLLPVYDSVVQAAIQRGSKYFWKPLWNELHDDNGALAEELELIRGRAGGHAYDASLIRILDAAIWMRNRSASDCRLDFRPRTPR